MSAKVRVFVDTNVLLYAFDTSAGEKRGRALEVIDTAWRDGNGCVSVQVLQEFYVNATRKLERRLPVETAKRLVASLSRWEVHAPEAEDVLSAIDLQQHAHLSFWDAMVLQSAGKLGCSLLYSEDLNAGQRIAGVTIVNPFIEGPDARA
jgi:predicted nucleic acid-binding protein